MDLKTPFQWHDQRKEPQQANASNDVQKEYTFQPDVTGDVVEPIVEKEKEVYEPEPATPSYIPQTFDQAIDYTKMQGLADGLRDKEFRSEIQDETMDIVKANLESEKSKIILEDLRIQKDIHALQFEKEKISVERFRSKYGGKLDYQEYIYRSWQPILNFAFIDKPVNVWFAGIVIFFCLVTGIYPVAKILDGCLGKPIRWFFGLFRKPENKRDYKERLNK